jgi:hypothetical protein
MIHRVAFALLVVGVMADPTTAQDAPGKVLPTPQAPPIRDQTAVQPSPIRNQADVPPPPPRPALARSTQPAEQARRAIARGNPPARRASTDPITRRDYQSSQGRFENPGGVGRYAEYYTASTPTSQFDTHALPPTRFDKGGGPDRAEQIASFRGGQQRTANIQNNINAYGRPYGAMGAGLGFGFGLGYGLYGGGLR